MGAMFIGQQFLQNVLGYDTLEAGAAILPAVVLMVIVAPRSAKLVEARGARFTLLCGYVFCFLGFLTMLMLWDEGSPYWQVGLAYAFVGAGVGLRRAHPRRTRSPVRCRCSRAGMASATADLQRDLGGAIMQSLLGALLTAGYAARVRLRRSAARRTRPGHPRSDRPATRSRSRAPSRWPSTTRSTPTRSPPRRRSRSWPASAGPVRGPGGDGGRVALVWFAFPRHDEELALLQGYADEDRVGDETTVAA